MKKLLLLIAAAVFCASTAMADDDKSTVFTVRAGLNMMNNNLEFISGNSGSYGTGYAMGYDAAIGMQLGRTLYFGLEIGAKSRGWKCDNVSGDDLSGMAHSVYLAPSIGYKVGFGDFVPVKVAPHVGAYAGYDLSSSCDGYEFDELYDIDLNDYQKFNAGVRAGLSIWFRRAFVDISYDYDFIKILEAGNGSILQNGLVFSLGYSF